MDAMRRGEQENLLPFLDRLGACEARLAHLHAEWHALAEEVAGLREQLTDKFLASYRAATSLDDRAVERVK